MAPRFRNCSDTAVRSVQLDIYNPNDWTTFERARRGRLCTLARSSYFGAHALAGSRWQNGMMTDDPMDDRREYDEPVVLVTRTNLRGWCMAHSSRCSVQFMLVRMS